MLPAPAAWPKAWLRRDPKPWMSTRQERFEAHEQYMLEGHVSTACTAYGGPLLLQECTFACMPQTVPLNQNLSDLLPKGLPCTFHLQNKAPRPSLRARDRAAGFPLQNLSASMD